MPAFARFAEPPVVRLDIFQGGVVLIPERLAGLQARQEDRDLGGATRQRVRRRGKRWWRLEHRQPQSGAKECPNLFLVRDEE
jgi:hypothetical protein